MARAAVTSRRDLQTKLQQWRDVREILASMKSLAYMETRKLIPRLAAQAEAVQLIESAAADFLAHYPEAGVAGAALPATQTILVFGAERGFCGGFNEPLVQAVGSEPARLLAVGRKLAARLQDDARFHHGLEGAVVAEDAEAIIGGLVQHLGRQPHPLRLSLLYHDQQGVVTRLHLLPPFRTPPPRDPRPAPLLNLGPRPFFVELVGQYLFAVLHQVLFASLLAENAQRVRHLDGAVQRLDDQLRTLERRRHRLRQEEITEEIEIILLNADPGT